MRVKFRGMYAPASSASACSGSRKEHTARTSRGNTISKRRKEKRIMRSFFIRPHAPFFCQGARCMPGECCTSRQRGQSLLPQQDSAVCGNGWSGNAAKDIHRPWGIRHTAGNPLDKGAVRRSAEERRGARLFHGTWATQHSHKSAVVPRHPKTPLQGNLSVPASYQRTEPECRPQGISI